MLKDLTNRRFGRLTAIKHIGFNKWNNAVWLCKCDCGKEHQAASGKLLQGKVSSCGCHAKDLHIKQLQKHGITTGGKPRTLTIWSGMKARCLNPNATSYKNYGARGVKVCNEWMEFEKFHNWAIQNGYDEGLQLDRIDNDGNYEPTNCRWVDRTTNMINQRRNRIITIDERSQPISYWIKELRLTRSTVYGWLKQGSHYLEERLNQHYNKFKSGESA